MKKEVSFDDDIYKKVAERTGMSVKAVRTNAESIIHIINDMAKDPNVGGIILPKLGTMYFKLKKAERIRDVIRESDRGPNSFDGWLEKKIDNLNKSLEKDGEGKSYSRHKKYERISNIFLNKGLSLKEVEDLQNNYKKSYDEGKEYY